MPSLIQSTILQLRPNDFSVTNQLAHTYIKLLRGLGVWSPRVVGSRRLRHLDKLLCASARGVQLTLYQMLPELTR
jgi:hypothetical protein